MRAYIKELGEALNVDDAVVADWKIVAATLGESVVNSVAEMIYKEENILFPMCLTAFTARDWAEIWNASSRYGWCLVEPLDGYRPDQGAVKPGLEIPATEGIALPTGTLSLEQLIAIFSTLPADLTFVDADDRLVFFSEGPERVFARSRAVLGRKVQNCHPPKSVHIVERILEDFRAGRQNVAEFWLNFHGRFVHVRYFAVRDREQRIRYTRGHPGCHRHPCA
ncbi:MAG: PAS domain-containing protein [Bryobacterales bacterium]|nr:PAS domain-containing protein [Bryobacterales bacterium]